MYVCMNVYATIYKKLFVIITSRPSQILEIKQQEQSEKNGGNGVHNEQQLCNSAAYNSTTRLVPHMDKRI